VAGQHIISLFAGAGGMDLGFEAAGFTIIWANEFDKSIWQTYRANHSSVLDTRDIRSIDAGEIPDCDGIIGGPPCQSWSAAGAKRGIADSRGQLFHDFIRILRAKQPKFFVAENVAGMLSKRHASAVQNILNDFKDAGYSMHIKLLNAHDFGVPQDRKRLFYVGIRADLASLNPTFIWPTPIEPKLTLHHAIADLADNAMAALAGSKPNPACSVANHEYLTGSFSSLYLSRNRVRNWQQPSFTIQAGGRHAPLHPQAPQMIRIERDKHAFVAGQEQLYRRLSVRECARIQTFPDSFIFSYTDLNQGYKMIGNAVPMQLTYHLASALKSYFTSLP
jgi:DNA (cytosine-5)-methyltransferase 1